jgi:hypothetical protein
MVKMLAPQRTNVSVVSIGEEAPAGHASVREISHGINRFALKDTHRYRGKLVGPRRRESRSRLCTDSVLVSPIRDGQRYASLIPVTIGPSFPHIESGCIQGNELSEPIPVFRRLLRAELSTGPQRILDEHLQKLLASAKETLGRHFRADLLGSASDQPSCLNVTPTTDEFHFRHLCLDRLTRRYRRFDGALGERSRAQGEAVAALPPD